MADISSITLPSGDTYNIKDSDARKRVIYYGTCGTAAATQAKTVSITGITELYSGLMLRILFTYAQTYNGVPTLNVNSLGAKNIGRYSGTNAARYEWLANEVVDLVYDGTRFVIVNGGIASTTYYGFTKLSSSTSSTSEALAATPKAVKTAYDLADGKQNPLTADNKNIQIVAGAIRNSGNGWAFISDSGHEPINVTSVSVDSETNDIVINHPINATKILSFVAGCDETFAIRYNVGASVGLDLTKLRVYNQPHNIGGMIIINNGTIDLQYSDFASYEVYQDGGIKLVYPERVPDDCVYKFSVSALNVFGVPYSFGNDYCIVKAINSSGAVYTNINNFPSNTRIAVTVPVARKQVDPSTLVSEWGNFWFIGLFEISTS